MEGKLRRGPLTPPLSQREARPPRRAARTRASSSLMERASRLPAGWVPGDYNSQHAARVQGALPGGGPRTCSLELAGVEWGGGVVGGAVVHVGRAHPAFLAQVTEVF